MLGCLWNDREEVGMQEIQSQLHSHIHISIARESSELGRLPWRDVEVGVEVLRRQSEVQPEQSEGTVGMYGV